MSGHTKNTDMLAVRMQVTGQDARGFRCFQDHGTRAVAKAKPDGLTITFGNNQTHGNNMFMLKEPGYDAVKDFAPVTGLGKGGQVLVVNASAPYKNVGELLAFAKKNPGKLSFGSGSSSSRMAGEMLKQLAAVDILHVPYKSNPLAITDLLGGQIDLMITDTSTGVPQVKAGKLRALGYSTQKRSAQLPDVPTLDEAGVKETAALLEKAAGRSLNGSYKLLWSGSLYTCARTVGAMPRMTILGNTKPSLIPVRILAIFSSK